MKRKDLRASQVKLSTGWRKEEEKWWRAEDRGEGTKSKPDEPLQQTYSDPNCPPPGSVRDAHGEARLAKIVLKTLSIVPIGR